MAAPDLTWVTALPKAELHLHIEGTLEPEMMFDLAARNGVPVPYADVDAVRAAYTFADLQSFLDVYYAGCSVLRTEQDFYDLTAAYLQRAAADGVRHAEMFFDPQTHTSRGVDFGTVIDGIREAMADASRRHGISSGLIMCFLRHLSADDAADTLLAAEPFLDRLVGVGLDSAEAGHPPSKFAAVFDQARARGLRTVAHAGEEGPPEYIRQALDLLGADRIDHGVRCLEDTELVDRLVTEQVALTVCPMSNVALRVVPDLGRHPLRRMLEVGLNVSINSDDPAYFGGYVAQNYLDTARALGLTAEQLLQVARNSIRSAFLAPTAIASLLASVDEFAAGARSNAVSDPSR